MKKILIFAVLVAGVMISDGCKKDNKDDGGDDFVVLDQPYSGKLFLLFSNTYPAFLDTTSVPVEVDIAGHMVFGIGELQYSGEDNNGQSKIRRQGELIIAPNGDAFKDQGEVYFAVDENTSVDETFTVWAWDGSQWIQMASEHVTDTWNDGLSFNFLDATLSGSVVEVVTANGTVRWTLTLSPYIQ